MASRFRDSLLCGIITKLVSCRQRLSQLSLRIALVSANEMNENGSVGDKKDEQDEKMGDGEEGVAKDVDRLNIAAITRASESKRTEHNSANPAKHDVGQCHCSFAPIGNAIWSAVKRLPSEGTEAEYWVPFMYHAALLPH